MTPTVETDPSTESPLPAALDAPTGSTPEGGKFQTQDVLTIASGHFVHDSFSAFVSPLLPLIQEKFSTSYAATGGLAIFLQVPSLLNPFIGYAADRISLRYFIILAPAITGTLCSALGLADSYVLLALLLFAAGVSVAAFHAPAPAMIGRISGSRLGTGMSIFMASGELGRTVGPLAVIAAVSWFGLEGIWRMAVIGWLFSGFLYWRLRDVSARPDRRGAMSLAQMWPDVQRLYPPLLWILATRVCLSIALTTFLPLFMQDEMGFDFRWAGLSLTVLEGAGVAGAFFSGTASDWLGRRRILVVLFLAAPLIFLGFLYSSGWTAFLFLVALGFVTLSPTAVLLAIVQDSFRQNRALANGLFLTANFLTRSSGIWFVGSLADNFGLSTAFLVSGLLAFASAPAVFWLPEKDMVG